MLVVLALVRVLVRVRAWVRVWVLVVCSVRAKFIIENSERSKFFFATSELWLAAYGVLAVFYEVESTKEVGANQPPTHGRNHSFLYSQIQKQEIIEYKKKEEAVG